MLSPSPESSTQHTQNPVSEVMNNISSYDGNVLLAAVISLLVVILFVLLLHIYARWFISRRASIISNIRSRPTTTNSLFHNFTPSTTTLVDTTIVTKGLDPSQISSIPLFVYNYKADSLDLDYCVICLTSFEDKEIGKKLPKCEHSFHVECIDMWLHSHSNCPLCRDDHIVTSAADDESTTFSIELQTGISNCDQSPEESSLSLSSSLKRMLSRNRSESCKEKATAPIIGDLGD
ncbi:hypothetical protein ACFE04_013337 [Oxalis oulophora]